MNGSSRTKLLLLLLAAAVVALAAYYAWPHMQSLTGQASSIGEQAGKLQTDLDHAKTVGDQADRYAQLSGQLTAAVPDAPQVNAVIDELQGLCHSTGVDWVSGVPERTGDVQGVHAWSVSMNLSGSSAQISSFLAAVQADPRLFVIDTVTLTSADGAHVSGNVTVRAFATGTDGNK